MIEANNQYFDYEIAYNSQGKPYFLSNREIFFNISHSSNYVACVIGDRPVGIDIEKARKGRQNLAKRFFDISEAEWIKAVSYTHLAPLFKMLEAIFELFVPLVVSSVIDKGIVNADKGYICLLYTSP